MELLETLCKLLGDQAPLRARELARITGAEKRRVNQVLHSNPSVFIKLDDAHWGLARTRLNVVIPSGWTTAGSLEAMLTEHADLAEPGSAVFSFDEGSKLMFDAIGLLLTLTNQLAEAHVPVSLKFPSEDCSLLTFLGRAGFFDQLRRDVEVLPSRPPDAVADQYRGNSANLVELVPVEVGPGVDNSAVCTLLATKFMHHAGEKYKGAAVTLFGELTGNVAEHSCSTSGFAGLQKYTGNRPHLQTIVSDRGRGIAQTLRPTLSKHHPDVFARLGTQSQDTDVQLVRLAVEHGHLSSVNEEGRGLGLIRSHQCSKRFNASFSIRQERFSLQYRYRDGKLGTPEVARGLFPLQGTQICFDYELG